MEPSTSTSVNKVKTKQSSKLSRFLTSRKAAPYVFVTPFIVSFLLLFLYPMIQAVIMSFQQVLPGQVEFIGLRNYERLLNPEFYRALLNTSIYVVFTVLILVALPVILAVFLNSKLLKFRNFFRASLFVPALTSVIVAGVIFRMMFGESETAVINEIIGFFGISPVEWRYGSVSGMFLMVMLAAWRWIGVNILYFLAGLQNVSEELYEAADIDGANAFQKFFSVTLPSLKPVIIFVSTITIINGFRMFEESFVFWQNNSPGNIGLTVVGYIYQEGISQNDMGFGAAIGVVLMIIIFIVSIIQLKFVGAFKED
ncbi:carbohydrate ABC transporter permease [Salibacterium qingdaonense]|uniref:L-arabinose ABC transporter membrane protein n=1 Tax=Salibacterium qingdaonense TaxID=266892 RepID=A0A1I4I1G4_9BACI|nr:sugar ABC transporter permease [Salibacterium qingdaonense]SFL48265.1 L-arabinose ABC transporter membrane protein [Salibacterium qingdaonense]